MGNFYKKFIDIYQKQKNIDLYYKWIANNASYYERYFTTLALAISALLIPFDFLLYESPYIYLSFRVLLISAYIIQLTIIFKVGEKVNQKLFYPRILFPSLSYNIAYSYFLMKASHNADYYLILLLATFFVIIISNLFIYKFYREQCALVVISIVCLFISSIYNPIISQDIIKLIIFHIISFAVCSYYRYEFILSINSKYEYLSSLLPNKFAKSLSISDKKLDINDLFPTKEYYAVCLCSDWRDYQKITSTQKRNKVEKMLEEFYTIIYLELEKSNLDGQYYADWTADELFIIFYGSDSEKDMVRSEALKFAHSLATSIYMEITANVNKDIKYDIGLASGNGLIGLQGPPNFKKTSITGKVAGNSKRFETEAKELRKKHSTSKFPIIVMDKELTISAHNISIYKNLKSNKINGSVKDIKNYDLSAWSFIEHTS